MKVNKVITLEGQQPSTFRRRLILLAWIGGAAFIIYFVIIPFFETGGGMADTRPIPGDAGKFDPVGSYADVLAYAGEGAELVSISATYVRSDGTMELNASYSPAPTITYEFVRKLDKAPDNAPPLGAGSSNSNVWYEPIEIRLYQPGQMRKVTSSSVSYTYVNKGMQREVDDLTNSLIDPIVPAPTCSFDYLWALALTKDAPAEAVAMIQYDADGYRFSISGLPLRLQFGNDCAFR